MSREKLYLAGDNWTPAHPSILKAISEANLGNAIPYGGDPWTQQAQELIRTAFQSKCQVLIVPSGTGANVLALRLACRRHESVICTDIGHIHYQESGAFESIVGCKLLTVPHRNGKLHCEEVMKKLKSERAFGRHSTSARVLSITQPTEVGTIYTVDELKALSDLCKKENLLLHIDGSRFYHAAASLDLSLHESLGSIKVDLLSLGGTKNGLMAAEAILIFNPALQDGSDHLHKQTLLLVSKMRYLSAQYIPFFKNNLWHTLAMHANRKAQELASIIQGIDSLSLSYPVETNQIFFTAPPSWIPLIQERVYCNVWNAEKNEIRLIASWNTSDQDIKDFKSAMAEVARAPA